MAQQIVCEKTGKSDSQKLVIKGFDKASPEASGSELPVKKIERLYSKD